MELKEYIQIIKKNIKIILAVTLAVIFASLIYFYVQPISYDTSLTLDVTRLGTQATQDYRYDNFYRLQADDKFADTVVKWLASPRVVTNIYAKANIDTKNLSLTRLSKSVSAQKQSSQIVTVNFSSPSQKSAQRISESLVKVISQDTQKLNKYQKETNWFKIISEKPIIVKHTFNYKIIFLGAFLVGIFLAFWVTLIKDYLEK